ncbi:hypothetical protein TCSYLVIO_007166 [Trypanosoma cruzi]|nr:hypothetical protein TCSYLVIO_007166 [Trypanosoma cruzi]
MDETKGKQTNKQKKPKEEKTGRKKKKVGNRDMGGGWVGSGEGDAEDVACIEVGNREEKTKTKTTEEEKNGDVWADGSTTDCHLCWALKQIPLPLTFSILPPVFFLFEDTPPPPPPPRPVGACVYVSPCVCFILAIPSSRNGQNMIFGSCLLSAMGVTWAKKTNIKENQYIYTYITGGMRLHINILFVNVDSSLSLSLCLLYVFI